MPYDYQEFHDLYNAGDYAACLKVLRPLAEQGTYYVAQYLLGTMYVKGEGVIQDSQEALKWFRLAADAEFPAAMGAIGQLYLNGPGFTQDYKEALKWFRLAADKGLRQAQYNIGHMYFEGKGVTKDEKEAANWFRLAADQGLRQAQYNLGMMLHFGKGVTKDEKEAANWFRLAATEGDDELNPWNDAVNKRIKDKTKEVVDYAFQNLKLFGLVQPHEMETIELDGNIVKAPTKIFYSMNFNVDLSVSSFSPEEYKEKMWLHIFNSLEPPPRLAQSFYVIEIYPKDDSRRAFFQCVPLGDEQSLHADWENGQRVIHSLLIRAKILAFTSILTKQKSRYNENELFNIAFTKCINYYKKELLGKPICNVSRNTSDKSKLIYDSFGKKENDSDERIYYPPDIFNESS